MWREHRLHRPMIAYRLVFWEVSIPLDYPAHRIPFLCWSRHESEIQHRVCQLRALVCLLGPVKFKSQS